MERLWRKRADFDAKLLASRAASPVAGDKFSVQPPSPAHQASEEVRPSSPLPPVQAAESQTRHSTQQEQQQRPQAHISIASTRLSSSGVLSRAKRLVSSTSRASAPPPKHSSTIGASAPPLKHSSTIGVTPSDARGGATVTPLAPIAVAAMKFSDRLPDDGAFVSGINLMGRQLDATVRSLNQSSFLQRSRTRGTADIKGENTLMLIQAVASNDSNTVNSMLQNGLGSIGDTDSSGNSTHSPPRPPKPKSFTPAIAAAAL